MDVFQEPVHEKGERRSGDLLGEVVRDVGVARGDVPHRLGLVVEVHRFVVHELLHDLDALGHVEVEALTSVLLGVDEVLDLDALVPVDLEMVEMDKEERQRGETLLAVHDEPMASLVADDNRSKEVVAVALDLVTGVSRLVGVEELLRQVVDQFADLPLLPCVLALIEVDGVLGLVKQLPDGACVAVDGLSRGFCGGHTEAYSRART